MILMVANRKILTSGVAKAPIAAIKLSPPITILAFSQNIVYNFACIPTSKLRGLTSLVEHINKYF